MRTIKYKVEHQLITAVGDLSNIYAGSENYLELEFDFDDNWKDCVKAVVFVLKDTEKPVILKNNKCTIPSELCQNRFIRFYLVGKKPDYRIQTNKTRIGVKRNG